MGDRVAVLKDGVLQQVDTPRALYDTPANAFVAAFIGSPSMNIMTARIAEGGVVVNGATIQVERAALAKASGDTVLLGVRPEDLELGDIGIPMTVALVEELGADTFVYGTAPGIDGTMIDLVARSRGFQAPAVGASVQVNPTKTYVFDTAGEQVRLS